MTEDDLERARAENAVLGDQLRRARADLHRLGARDMYRMLWMSVASGALGLSVGVALGACMLYATIRQSTQANSESA